MTCVRLSVKEPIERVTGACIAAPIEGSTTSGFEREHVKKNSVVACGVADPKEEHTD